jgi:hypothetical protein
MPNDFYTYVHQTPDGRVFYVGKGRGSRASRPSNRNPHWNAVVKKCGAFEWHIVAEGLDEQSAYEHEKELIASLRSMGEKLCNVTDGGDGGGRNKKRVCCVETGEVFESATTAARHFGLSPAAVVLAAQGKRMKTAGGKRFFYVPNDASEEDIRVQVAYRLSTPVPTPRAHRKQRSEEHRRKLSQVNTGKKHSAATLLKLSAANKGKLGGQHFNSKPVICISTGRVFPSSREAGQWAVDNGYAKDADKARVAINAAVTPSAKNNRSCKLQWARAGI